MSSEWQLENSATKMTEEGLINIFFNGLPFAEKTNFKSLLSFFLLPP